MRAIYDDRIGFESLSNMACKVDGTCYTSVRRGAEYCIGMGDSGYAPTSSSWDGNCMMTNSTCDCMMDFYPVLMDLSEYLGDAYVDYVDGATGGGIIDVTRDAMNSCM